MKRKHKLGERIDLPPYEPWPKEPPARTRSEVVAAMRGHREWHRNIDSAKLVPADVRAASMERWRTEHEALLAQEDTQRLRLEIEAATWELWCTRPWWQRLIDCLFGAAPPALPIGQRIRSPFADITIFRQAPRRPDVGVDLTGERWCSSFDCPMPQGDGEP